LMRGRSKTTPGEESAMMASGAGTTSLSGYVAEVEKKLKDFDLKTLLTPVGTILEGDLDVVLQAVRAAHEVPFSQGALRVGTTLRIDERRDKEITMEGKVRSVEEKLRGKTTENQPGRREPPPGVTLSLEPNGPLPPGEGYPPSPASSPKVPVSTSGM